jgi:hypothetical protein
MIRECAGRATVTLKGGSALPAPARPVVERPPALHAFTERSSSSSAGRPIAVWRRAEPKVCCRWREPDSNPRSHPTATRARVVVVSVLRLAAASGLSLQMAGEVLVHFEHGHLVLAEDLPEFVVAQDFAAVLRVLRRARCAPIRRACAAGCGRPRSPPTARAPRCSIPHTPVVPWPPSP